MYIETSTVYVHFMDNIRKLKIKENKGKSMKIGNFDNRLSIVGWFFV